MNATTANKKIAPGNCLPSLVRICQTYGFLVPKTQNLSFYMENRRFKPNNSGQSPGVTRQGTGAASSRQSRRHAMIGLTSDDRYLIAPWEDPSNCPLKRIDVEASKERRRENRFDHEHDYEGLTQRRHKSNHYSDHTGGSKDKPNHSHLPRNIGTRHEHYDNPKPSRKPRQYKQVVHPGGRIASLDPTMKGYHSGKYVTFLGDMIIGPQKGDTAIEPAIQQKGFWYGLLLCQG